MDLVGKPLDASDSDQYTSFWCGVPFLVTLFWHGVPFLATPFWHGVSCDAVSWNTKSAKRVANRRKSLRSVAFFPYDATFGAAFPAPPLLLCSTSSISANVNNIPMLNGTNFKKWKKHVIIVLGCMDLDYVLREDRVADLIGVSTIEQRAAMEKWERSNRMNLMIMKHSILEAIRGAIHKESRAKTFLDQIANRFAAK
ncbi:hypothetical protein CK203_097824 [Vitis vinifera]|uniref:Uncharacterized protein n=1 Tax=Vitis vinifera TaxID=29760 RepID=A0A438DFY0_VITVI|nr:hypothetical protein CK203_097824 [Vitis vinifera]